MRNIRIPGGWQSRQYARKLCRGGGVTATVVATICALSLSGCVVNQPTGPAIDRYAIAVAEPRAATIGRDILSSGGNAADAAVAAALAMTVTLPSRVGLGGGGACLVHDPETGEVRTLDFRAGKDGGAAPGLLRGLAALHAEYGSRRWEAVVSPAETLARFEQPVSRALAIDLAAGGQALTGQAAAVFAPGGVPAMEGQRIAQPQLAATLSRIRAEGVGGFYSGALGRGFAEAAAAAGHPVSVEALRGYSPEWRESLAAEVGNDVLFFASGEALSGPAQADIWRRFAEEGSWSEIADGERLEALAAALPGAPIPDGATLSVVDRTELAVTCGFTQGGLFGAGEMAGDTGILIAEPVPPGVASLGGLALLANEPKRQVLFAATGAGAASALAVPMLEVLEAGQPLEAALAAPRIASVDGAVRTEAEAGPIGRTGAVWCDWNRADRKTCYAESDPRGGGLSAVFQF